MIPHSANHTTINEIPGESALLIVRTLIPALYLEAERYTKLLDIFKTPVERKPHGAWARAGDSTVASAAPAGQLCLLLRLGEAAARVKGRPLTALSFIAHSYVCTMIDPRSCWV